MPHPFSALSLLFILIFTATAIPAPILRESGIDLRSEFADISTTRSIGSSAESIDTRMEHDFLAPRVPKDDSHKKQQAKQDAKQQAQDTGKKVAEKVGEKAAIAVGGMVAAAAVPVVGEIVQVAKVFETIIEGVIGAIKKASAEDHEVRFLFLLATQSNLK